MTTTPNYATVRYVKEFTPMYAKAKTRAVGEQENWPLDAAQALASQGICTIVSTQ